MYAVVGCNECATMWLVTDPETSETAQCPRCGKTHKTAKLKRFFESEDRAAAQQARSALLAKKHDDSDAFADVAHVTDLEDRVADAGVDDEEYLEAAGLDPAAVSAAGERAERGDGRASGGSRSRTEIVRDGVEEAEEPTADAVVAYARDRGVPPEKARELLDKLTRRGELSESRGRYRVL